VRPDDRVLDPRLLLYVDALAEHRVDDLRAGLDGAAVGDDRSRVNLRGRRRVEVAATLFDLDVADEAGEQVVVRLQVARGRADVEPVGLFRRVRVEGQPALQ
jgi:hypothetical protein